MEEEATPDRPKPAEPTAEPQESAKAPLARSHEEPPAVPVGTKDTEAGSSVGAAVVAAPVRIESRAPKPLAAPAIPAVSDAEAERRIRAMSRRSFLWAAGAVAGTWFGIQWLGTRRFDNNIPWPLRRVLEVNENLSRDLFSPARLAPEFSKSMASMPRANGSYGVASDPQPDWKLQLVGFAGQPNGRGRQDSPPGPVGSGPSDAAAGGAAPSPSDKKGGPAHRGKGGATEHEADTADASSAGDTEAGAHVTMDQIRALPKSDVVTELKCIEGWSTIVHWTGCRLVDFMLKYPPATKSGRPFDPAHLDDLPEYVSMETPDGAYFVGLDMASALHPQTLLCYEMNGAPLPLEHGAPLRLAIPVKYGIKNIKNIGKIECTDVRPKDYWAQLGYDWYAGH